MFGGSFSNAYEERARIKKTAKAAAPAARAANFGADAKSSVAKYPFAVRLNEKQLLSHVENVLKVFADPATAQKLKAAYVKAKASGNKKFDIDDAAMEEDFKVFDKEWESNSMGLSRLEYRKMGLECIRRARIDYPNNHELIGKLEMFMQSISLVINSIVMPKKDFEDSYKSYMKMQQHTRKMLEKAMKFWGRGLDPSPQAAEWMKLSKDKIEPILEKWKTFTPEQVLKETSKIPVADQNAIAFYRMLKVVEQKKNMDKAKAAGKTPPFLSS